MQALAGDVVNGNLANATFQGQALGNLAAGSSATQLNKLVDKWFLGADHPALCNTSLVYKSAAGSLFPHTPSHTDEYQGQLGDCYFISALGTLADSNPAAVQNMFIDNGDGTYTVRFYTGTYGTIYNYTDGSIGAGFKRQHRHRRLRDRRPHVAGRHARACWPTPTTAPATPTPPTPCGSPWPKRPTPSGTRPARKAATALNAYASIQGGWMATVDAQVLGYNATDYIMTTTSEQVAINALAANKAVTIGTLSWSGTNYGLYANHAYAIIGYNASTDTFTLYNPWGSNQPGQLTWSQLQADSTRWRWPTPPARPPSAAHRQRSDPSGSPRPWSMPCSPPNNALSGRIPTVGWVERAKPTTGTPTPCATGFARTDGRTALAKPVAPKRTIHQATPDRALNRLARSWED